MVSGHVNRPGTYDFVPGHTVIDYISMAGGTNYKGSNGSAIVIRDSKKIKNPKDMQIHRGDIILVKRSAEDILIGEISILSFVSLIATIASTVITAFIAAGNI
jgi:protein involved in polysaccharide export with SLBB domain